MAKVLYVAGEAPVNSLVYTNLNLYGKLALESATNYTEAFEKLNSGNYKAVILGDLNIKSSASGRASLRKGIGFTSAVKEKGLPLIILVDGEAEKTSSRSISVDYGTVMMKNDALNGNRKGFLNDVKDICTTGKLRAIRK
ncbi:MAG: hypothetical protein AABW50_02100 [Nanoarchaeota archaeon]